MSSERDDFRICSSIAGASGKSARVRSDGVWLQGGCSVVAEARVDDFARFSDELCAHVVGANSSEIAGGIYHNARRSPYRTRRLCATASTCLPALYQELAT